MTRIEEYAAPRTLNEVLEGLSDGNATILAGGTDLMPRTRAGTGQLRSRLINIRRTGELRGITEAGGRIRIGALTTVTDILDSGLLRERARVLVDTADCFASGQVRNSATIGGNICNASPAGDMIIPLLLLDAAVELACWKNGKAVRRTMPLCEFFVGPGETKMRPDELLTCIAFAVPEKGTIGLFSKFGTRPALDIAVVSVGISGVRTNGCLRGVRVAFGAVAPTPLRGWQTEAALEGAALHGDAISAVAQAAKEEISPISDVRASAWYRKEVLCHLTQRLLHDVGRTAD